MSQSKEHKFLKTVGYNFLKNLGCSDIKFELPITSLETNKIIYIDVAGILNNKIVVLECGGSPKEKLIELCHLVIEDKVEYIYILPYGSKEPFLYKPSYKLCKCCGNKLTQYEENINLNEQTIEEKLTIANKEIGIDIKLSSYIARDLILNFKGMHLRKEIIEYCKSNGINEPTANKILFQLYKNKRIEKIDYGIYKIN